MWQVQSRERQRKVQAHSLQLQDHFASTFSDVVATTAETVEKWIFPFLQLVKSFLLLCSVSPFKSHLCRLSKSPPSSPSNLLPPD